VKPALMAIQDLSAREVAILAPLVAFTIILGVYPGIVFDATSVSVAHLVAQEQTALGTLPVHEANARSRSETMRVASVQSPVPTRTMAGPEPAIQASSLSSRVASESQPRGRAALGGRVKPGHGENKGQAR
jgi:hypothetical protein